MASGSSVGNSARSSFVGLRPPRGEGRRELMKLSSITVSTVPSSQNGFISARRSTNTRGSMTNDHQHSLHHHVRPQAGESAPFHFENRWRVNASVRDVWSVLSDIEAWPQWWPSLPVAVPIDDTIATGSRADIQVDSPIGVTLSFSIELQETEAPYFVIFSAAGDLRGTGAWSLQQTGPITTISSVWCVTTRRRSIRLLRPVATSMHSRVMRAGHCGLARHLNRLVS